MYVHVCTYVCMYVYFNLTNVEITLQFPTHMLSSAKYTCRAKEPRCYDFRRLEYM